MKYGFTGSQKGTDEKIILSVLKLLPLAKNDIVITGACIGIDAQISNLVAKHYPKIKQLLIIPTNRKKVDFSVYKNANKIIKMPSNSTYRNRNEEIVRQSDLIIAFWTGQKIFSGTYMTINIAKRAGKPLKIVHI